MLTAFGWGTADFIARFTGRDLGPRMALFGMLLTSGAVLTGVVLLSGAPSIPGAEGRAAAGDPDGGLGGVLAGAGAAGWATVAAMGLGITVGTLLLYWALARGPVTVVAPIVASYPAFNLLIAVATGTRPPAGQWAAMAAVMAGVVIVATLAAPDESGAGPHPRAHVQASAGIAISASLVFALTLEASQAALLSFGEIHTVWLSRLVGVAVMAAVLLTRRERTGVPLRAWPLLAAQGVLDGGAYLALLAGSRGPGADITIVVGSTFAAVTVGLARVVLKEPMTRAQWVGIALVIGGVAALSGMS